MKKLLIALGLLGLASTAHADFFGGGNNGEWKMGPYGPYWEENDWPEWTPMYWMQEMSDSFNNNNNGFNFNNGFSNGNFPFMGNNNYGNYSMPMMPYGYNAFPAAPMPYYGYNYGVPTPQAPVMPAPPTAPVNTAPGPSNNAAEQN